MFSKEFLSNIPLYEPDSMVVAGHVDQGESNIKKREDNREKRCIKGKRKHGRATNF